MNWFKKSQQQNLTMVLCGILYGLKTPIKNILIEDKSKFRIEQTKVLFYTKAEKIIHIFNDKNYLGFSFSECELLAYDVVDLIINSILDEINYNAYGGNLFYEILKVIKDEIKGSFNK